MGFESALKARSERDRREHDTWLSANDGYRCASLRVLWGRLGPATRPERAHAEIEIAIPGINSSVDLACHTEVGRSIRSAVASPCISVIPAGQPHTVTWKQEAELTVFFLAPGFVDGLVQEGAHAGRWQMIGNYAALDPFIRQLGLSLVRDLEGGRNPGQLYLDSIACVLGRHLLNNYGLAREPVLSRGDLPKHKLKRVTEFIEDHLADKLTLENLAEVAQLSAFHFARSFKRSTGLAPHRYLLQRRIERARELLQRSALSTAEVALAVGFADQSHMTATFRKFLGATPKAFCAAQACTRPRKISQDRCPTGDYHECERYQ